MRKAQAHEVAHVLAAKCKELLGATDVQLYLVDYRIMLLEPMLGDDSDALPIADGPAGECFRDQRVHRLEGWLYVPVTMRGNRLGVLALRSDHGDDEQLTQVGEAVGQAVTLAQRATDRYRSARRSERMTLAAEMQWELLPGRALITDRFSLAGQLEPAYELAGDNFDWSADDDGLTLTVTNGMGTGVDASLLTTLATTALRNARRAGLELAEQAELADQAVWGQHGGDRYVSTLLLHLDASGRDVTLVDAGSPHLWLVRGETVDEVALDAQLPLGMFAETRYTAQHLPVNHGDRLFVFSDGVLDATVGDRRYGESLLAETVRASAGLTPSEVVRTIINDLLLFHGSEHLRDDAVVVCVDLR